MPHKKRNADPAPASSAAAYHHRSSGLSQPAVAALQLTAAGNQPGNEDQHARNILPFQLKFNNTGQPDNLAASRRRSPKPGLLFNRKTTGLMPPGSCNRQPR
ncbi:hypothetical protein F0L74_21685 [Chitinophaga agrisoli]|uniref:Uncharacterized protein n=1 Tax=Chitinophaga agrisoli TaxID=2607653 RepID=A0A5B2VKW3_9BACT|nr:hypothetical protein [Chitinophaga agrisoli]KAA2238829.1 hypothetical protein F0L74_21685 [Chitinophaga agrisoli]